MPRGEVGEIGGCRRRRGRPDRLAGRAQLVSPTITHKTDVGGVALDLRNEAELRAAFRAMVDRLSAAGRRQEVSGFLVEEMINRTEGVETFVGITEAAAFGSLIGFGLGGTQIELLATSSFASTRSPTSRPTR